MNNKINTFRHYWLTVLMLLTVLTMDKAFAQQRFESNGCYAHWKSDTLTVGNKMIEVKFLKSPAGLNIIEFTNSKLGIETRFSSNSSVFSIGRFTESEQTPQYEVAFIPQNPVTNGYMLVELLSSYELLDVRRQIRLYPDSPLISLDFGVKGKSGKLAFTPESGILLDLHTKGKHWRLKAVEFFDRTDRINTLVREHKILSFRYPEKLSGNLLLANDLLDKHSLIVLKEAPCSFVQLHYPGYDFSTVNGDIKVHGMGVAPGEIKTNSWTNTYSIALGVSGSDELETLSALRSYHEARRRLIPERDNMIMMNTWGDRNQDASINEAFVKKEIDACKKLNITHLQIDDGWQKGRSHNSADVKGALWDKWDRSDWEPDPAKFPKGFGEITEYAHKKGIKLGLWFHPTNEDNYATWKRDAQIVIDLYNKYGIRYFKIDGVKLPNKLAEINFRKFLDFVAEESNYEVVFNLDLTADNRGGYHYLNEYGNLFLENRYTDWGNYYPFWTLRNVWMLSKYIPPQKLQVEFLNPERNEKEYAEDDRYAPSRIPFDFQFAATFAGQPLAWFEGTGLSEKSYEIAPLVRQYREIQEEFHSGKIFPIGQEPSGSSWTGFQSINNEGSGYLLVYRENNSEAQNDINTYLKEHRSYSFKKVLGYGPEDFKQTTGSQGSITFSIPGINQFALYEYALD